MTDGLAHGLTDGRMRSQYPLCFVFFFFLSFLKRSDNKLVKTPIEQHDLRICAI